MTTLEDLETGRYGVIVADPPWSYNNAGCRGAAANEYATQSDDWLSDLDIPRIMADEAVLLLWATWPKLDVAMDLISEWGLEYVTGLPWVKVDSVSDDMFGETRIDVPYGIGFWVRGASEPLLIARRGDVSIRSNLIGLLSPNLQHSRKPDSVYALGDLLPGPRLEMFARRSRIGWDSWGNQSENYRATDDDQDGADHAGEGGAISEE